MVQANEYAASNEGLDIVYKILNTLALTHPMHTVRAAELQRWMAGWRLRPHSARASIPGAGPRPSRGR